MGLQFTFDFPWNHADHHHIALHSRDLLVGITTKDRRRGWKSGGGGQVAVVIQGFYQVMCLLIPAEIGGSGAIAPAPFQFRRPCCLWIAAGSTYPN